MSLDMVVLRLNEERLELLLETRDRPPFTHCWQLPALRIDDVHVRGDAGAVAFADGAVFVHQGGAGAGALVSHPAGQLRRGQVVGAGVFGGVDGQPDRSGVIHGWPKSCCVLAPVTTDRNCSCA